MVQAGRRVQVARTKERALVRLMGSAHLGEHEQSGAYILRSLSVVALCVL